LTDIEEKYLTSHKEHEAESTRRKANKHKTAYSFIAELHRQAEEEVQKLQVKRRRSTNNSRANTLASRRGKS
jgi:hypothetical protein